MLLMVNTTTIYFQNLLVLKYFAQRINRLLSKKIVDNIITSALINARFKDLDIF